MVRYSDKPIDISIKYEPIFKKEDKEKRNIELHIDTTKKPLLIELGDQAENHVLKICKISTRHRVTLYSKTARIKSKSGTLDIFVFDDSNLTLNYSKEDNIWTIQ